MPELNTTLIFSDLFSIHRFTPEEFFDKPAKFYATLDKIRSANNDTIIFADLTDGTTIEVIRAIVVKNDYRPENYTSKFSPQDDEPLYSRTQFNDIAQISPQTPILLEGNFVRSPEGKRQDFEFKIEVFSVCTSPERNPVIPRAMTQKLSLLRKQPFDRVFSRAIQALFRISSVTDLTIQNFLSHRYYIKVDPNILTNSSCEGAGDTFGIVQNIFPTSVGLTVSSQMPLESFVNGLRRVYTFQKSFRAEKSDTTKHLSEFKHLEIESKYTDLNQLLEFTEWFIKDVISAVYNQTKQDFDFLESKAGPSDIKHVRSFVEKLINRPFVKIKHRDAIDLINRLVENREMVPDDTGKLVRTRVKYLPKYDDDLGSEHEKLLVNYFGYNMLPESDRNQEFYGAFVLVTHWPFGIKSFYMKQLDDGTCESFDLLAPFVGELIGGSMREWRDDKIMSAVINHKMDPKPIEWYLSMRKRGLVMGSGGWGMGFERLVMMITGAPSVRDITPLPVYSGYCPY